MNAAYYNAAPNKDAEIVRPRLTLRELFLITTWLAEMADLEGERLVDERDQMRGNELDGITADPQDAQDLLDREADLTDVDAVLERFRATLDDGVVR